MTNTCLLISKLCLDLYSKNFVNSCAHLYPSTPVHVLLPDLTRNPGGKTLAASQMDQLVREESHCDDKRQPRASKTYGLSLLGKTCLLCWLRRATNRNLFPTLPSPSAHEAARTNAALAVGCSMQGSKAQASNGAPSGPGAAPVAAAAVGVTGATVQPVIPTGLGGALS